MEIPDKVLTGSLKQQQIDYSITIDPSLEYSSQQNSDDRPVYDDDLAAGKITYVSANHGSITAIPDETDGSLVIYSIDDGLQPFSVVDEWLFPIPCDDHSVFNKGELCLGRL